MSFQRKNILFLGVFLLAMVGGESFAATIALWNFNSPISDSSSSTGTLLANNGVFQSFIIGGVTNTFGTVISAGATDPETADDSELRLGHYPEPNTGNKTGGIEFRLSTAGYENIAMTWDQENSNTGSRYYRVQYSVDRGTNWTDLNVITNSLATNWINQTFGANFSAISAANDNPDFRVRIVAEFQNTATGGGSTNYAAANTGSSYGQAGTCWYDMITFTGNVTISNISVLSYNILGHDATNFSTTNLQVQAIGRVLSHLKPDVVGFQEVPELFYSQMENFIDVYLPGYSFVCSSQQLDGAERSGVASRFPIVRSKSLMPRADLTSFGYNGVYTRDLFEAQITIPGFSQPLHFFTTHLKAFADPDPAARRGAESRAVSNFFATVYLTTNSLHPYVLVGDMNEDYFRPRANEEGAITNLVSAPTGLILTKPLNPVTADERTWSAQNPNPTIRFDYILPNELLFSNIVSSQVFRSDKVSPITPPLLSTDNATASDHYPVMMVFRNPYDVPIRIRSITFTNPATALSWTTVVGGRYRVEASTNLTTWTTVGTNLTATNNQMSFQTIVGSSSFFRIAREF